MDDLTVAVCFCSPRLQVVQVRGEWRHVRRWTVAEPCYHPGGFDVLSVDQAEPVQFGTNTPTSVS